MFKFEVLLILAIALTFPSPTSFSLALFTLVTPDEVLFTKFFDFRKQLLRNTGIFIRSDLKINEKNLNERSNITT